MSDYNKAYYEATKHWRARQLKARREEEEKARVQTYGENREEIETAKKAAFIIAALSRIDPAARWLGVKDILGGVKDRNELEYYYKFVCMSLR